jgi:lysophospholipid acyltransferase (LPLAT)-like uncharacterized protein
MIAYGLAPLINSLDGKIVNYANPPASTVNESSEHCIILFWHEFILLVSPGPFTDGKVTALCSQHRDGELVSQTAESLGINVVRGSTSRGGVKAIRQLQKAAKFSSIVMTPDGPRGPRREMAAGAIFLASKLGLPIVPVGVGVSSAYRLNTWDRFVIPMPWSRIRLVVGPKLHLPKRLRKAELESHRQGCEQLLNDMTQQADDWAENDTDIPNQRRYSRFRRHKHLWIQAPTGPPNPKPLGRGELE